MDLEAENGRALRAENVTRALFCPLAVADLTTKVWPALRRIRGNALIEFCFRLLGCDHAVEAECFMLASSNAEACEIADALNVAQLGSAVEVVCNGASIYRAA